MKITRRTFLIILILLLILALGILFNAFILENIVLPIALVFWLLWRVILSVDQIVYWIGLIFSIFIYIFIRLAMRPAKYEESQPYSPNDTLETLNYWRSSILLTSDEIDTPNNFKRNLSKILAEFYASKQDEATPYAIYEAMEQRQIPLPERVYTFLFSDDSSHSKKSLRQILQTIWQKPRKWIDHWTHRDVIEYHRSINEVLEFIESSMEIRHDDEDTENRNY